MAWLTLSLAILLEICGTTCMKLSEGFTRLQPSILIFVFYGLSFAAFTFALKRIDLSFAYAVWAGVGVLIIGAIGIIYFKEPISALKIASMVLIALGVAGLYGSDILLK
jgi:small multidrug resistance pump